MTGWRVRPFDEHDYTAYARIASIAVLSHVRERRAGEDPRTR